MGTPFGTVAASVTTLISLRVAIKTVLLKSSHLPPNTKQAVVLLA